MLRDFNDGDIEDEIREALRMFDKEGNGFIKSAGWKNALKCKLNANSENFKYM